MRTVVFDLDGTLVDTSRDLIAAANATFKARGLAPPLDPVADAGIGFRGGRAMLRVGHARLQTGGDDAVERDFPLFIEQYTLGLCVHSRVYPGARDAVARLAAAGVALSICTNKPEALAMELMHALGFTEPFKALIGADTLTTRKPAAEPVWAAIDASGGDRARAVLVGDTVTDREAARAAGIASLLVTFGPAAQEMPALEPDGLLRSFDEIEVALDALGL